MNTTTTIQICPNKIKNWIIFRVKSGYKLELLTPEKTKLLGSTKKEVNKDKNGENVPKLESIEVVLVHCNLVKMIVNNHQKFYLLLFQTKNTVNTEFSSVEVWFTDQVRKALEIEDNVNLTLIIG